MSDSVWMTTFAVKMALNNVIADFTKGEKLDRTKYDLLQRRFITC